MPTKLRDLAVKTGEYTDGQGQKKGRWQNIGALMKSDDGGEFVILHRWFNPAGVPNPDNRDSVLVSCFNPNQQNQQQGQPPQQPQNSGQAYRNAQNGTPPQQNQQPQQNYGAPNTGQYDNFDDEIPFN